MRMYGFTNHITHYNAIFNRNIVSCLPFHINITHLSFYGNFQLILFFISFALEVRAKLKTWMNHYRFQSNMFSTFHISYSVSLMSHATHFAYHLYSRIDGVNFNEYAILLLFVSDVNRIRTVEPFEIANMLTFPIHFCTLLHINVWRSIFFLFILQNRGHRNGATLKRFLINNWFPRNLSVSRFIQYIKNTIYLWIKNKMNTTEETEVNQGAISLLILFIFKFD